MLDLTRPIQRRDGKAVRILASNINSNAPIVAVMANDKGEEYVWQYNRNGRSAICELSTDLVNVPEKHKRTVWLNIYKENIMAHLSEHNANSGATPTRIACVSTEIEYEV